MKKRVGSLLLALALCLSLLPTAAFAEGEGGESGESAAILPRSVVRRLRQPDIQMLSLRCVGGAERIWLAAAWRETEDADGLVAGVVRGAAEAIAALPEAAETN